ncbi:MAG TPA: methylmalonyl Co-A mutase-associated GTPase MeaB [Candidatus Sulfopaludibacter sp.]|nr:methylmalonyl Co-A mutase-associated GTPase MeaB [Candidatus Sulfopaludibacter sp.]
MSDGNDSALQVSAPEAPGAAPGSTRRKSPSRAQYVEGILAGDRSVLAQAITLIESSRPADRELADQLVESCLAASGDSLRVGITGVPGAGKSCLIEALGNHLIQQQGLKVAVLAIDPSSERTGGSILGDKTRMATLAASEMAFIRPSPSRGSFGGVAQRTREAMLLCEAAGYRTILVETVGVGQSETAVHNMVDFFLLVTLAGAGDELQGIKRGVMELADLVAINKADGENVAAAERTVAETDNALHFLAASPSGWMPRALACSALCGRGIAEIWNAVLEHATLTRASGWFDENRREQRRWWMHETLESGLRQFFSAHPLIRMRMEAFERDVLDGKTTPFRAARVLLEMYSNLGSVRA